METKSEPVYEIVERYQFGNDSDDFNIRHEQEDTVRQVKRRQCTFCTLKFEELQDLRNHTLSHFKKQLLANLPSSEPFNCPTCQEIRSPLKMMLIPSSIS